MDDIKLLAKNVKEFGNSIKRSRNIQLGHWDGIWHRKMHYANDEKRETTPDRWNGTTKSRKN